MQDPYICPECHQKGIVINTRYYSNGYSWRRYQCPEGHRWSDREGKPLRPGTARGHMSEDIVRRILEDRQTSCRAMARLVGFTRSAVRKTRLGHRNAGILPEIPRWTNQECTRLEYPEVIQRVNPSICPQCAATGRVIESRIVSNGSRRRRRECPAGHRWTEWIGDRPHTGAMPGCENDAFRFKGRLCDGQIRLILERRDLSLDSVARLVGRSRETVRHIRYGITYRSVLPELPRWKFGEIAILPTGRRTTLTCRDCIHWRGGCTMGFPDAEEMGITFARECSSFQCAEELAVA